MLSHINDNNNQPQMVDVSQKEITLREAHAQSKVILPKDIAELINNNEIKSKKGPVFQTAIIAGTMACKQTSQLIPFCHPLPLENCKIEITSKGNVITIDCFTKIHGKTGIEMEALTGASIAALTIYDMCKAMSHDINIIETKLISKSGGKSNFTNKV
ncbi:MAG: cyclic pyranopterin monophosphate synthase MoaC [Planctomycetota bacterium]|nr:MAG: cyclic pyranopterin monophosphate synthase MoaC [Planctomycetota bacterium]